MAKEVDIQRPVLDFIPDGETEVVEEGQHRLQGPILCEGELLITGHLIVE